jgi:iron complex outermembrane receptor protein
MVTSGTKYSVDIPAQNLGDALQAFALASHHKLLYSSDLVAGKKSPALKGRFTTEEGVKRLLASTDLTNTRSRSTSW